MERLLCRSLVVPQKDIFYISWTVDAYEGLGFLRTDDAKTGAVSLLYPSCQKSAVESLLDAFESEGIEIRRLGTSEEKMGG